MDLSLVGPGRAGLALSLAAHRAGHRIVGVLGRDAAKTDDAAARLETGALSWEEPLPKADLLLIAVRDDAIAAVAERLSTRAEHQAAAVHLSGLTPIAALAPLRTPVGSFHPLQTIPTPEAGAGRLPPPLIPVPPHDHPPPPPPAPPPSGWPDAQNPLSPAPAAAAANFPLAALAMSRRLFIAAGVD